jgi:hypothetical protein
MPNNQNKITGVIYSKPTRTAPDKKGKNGGQDYVFTSIILETDHPMRKSKTFPEFELGSKGLGIDDFEVGDNVEITFFAEGEDISWTDKQGNRVSKHISKNKAMYIRHSDITTDDSKSVGNYTPAEKRRLEKAEKSMLEPMPDPDEEEGDLPF